MLDFYGYDVGNLVQLVKRGRVYQVIWRSYIKYRTVEGVVMRTPVYRLDNDFWDCYHETELHSAWGNWD
jgi:hypothetical protein